MEATSFSPEPSRKPLASVRGMHDLLPGPIERWQHFEAIARAVLESYGFEEIRTPLLERTELFARSIGGATDIVEKEMYSFADRDGESLTLRPEQTASCVRAGIERGFIHSGTHRLWYMGPMFRYERPQKGRFRQFHQLGGEIFGPPGPEADAEIILLTARLWRRLGLNGLRLETNSLGTPEARRVYRARLVEYLRDHRADLDEDARRRTERNPLRVLDSKDPDVQGIIDGAPKLIDALDCESQDHFERLREMLAEAGVSFVVNPRLVRGLDYYTKTVFEWTTDRLGAQNAVCGGGRYDGLVEEIGGASTPGVGFSAGIERVIVLLAEEGVEPEPARPAVWVAAAGAAAARTAPALAEEVRDAGLSAVLDAGKGGFRAKLRRADRSGAEIAVIVGDAEAQAGEVSIKPLRADLPQHTVSRAALRKALGDWFPAHARREV